MVGFLICIQWYHQYMADYCFNLYDSYPELSSCRKLMGNFLFDKLTEQVILAESSSMIVEETDFGLVDDGLSTFVV